MFKNLRGERYMREITIPKVSIVVPVYNMQKYLKECMESLINQTLQEIEIICVDDGSTDASSVMLDEYAQKDNRIKVIHKENAGYGQTMNVGIAACTGEYIGIVEPDDYVELETYETLYQRAKENQLDMISADHKRFVGNEGDRAFRVYNITNEESLYNIVLNPSVNRDVMRGNFINPAGLFRKKFLEENHILHNETPGASYQDLGFAFQTLTFSERMMLIDTPLYCYRQDNPNSSIASKAKAHCVIEEYQYIYNIIKKNYEKIGSFLPQYQKRRFGSYMYTCNRIAMEYKKEFIYRMREEFIESQKKEELVTTEFPDKWKQQLNWIINEPEMFYEKYVYVGKEIHQKLQSFQSTIIYGAGMFGKYIYDKMYEEDKRKLLGFAVSDTNENLKQYKEAIIRPISDYEDKKGDIIVIIGVTEKYQKEIEEVLDRKGFKKRIYLKTDVFI